MALLVPNTTYTVNGVTVKEKIIPDKTRWKSAEKAANAGFSAGSLYKKEKKLTNNTGTVQTVTIHNTNDLVNVEDDGEQYTGATYNENMGSVRVHFYVDDLGAWQNLKAGTGMSTNDPEGSAEVSWHSGDGSVADGGNMTSLSIEIIMDDTPENDSKAKDNGARLAAWLLQKHGLKIDNLVTHTYWVNKSAGKSFSDRDEQCTNLVEGKKWCPAYIFGSTNHSVALANWKEFKSLVKKYLDELNTADTAPENQISEGESTSDSAIIEKNDLVNINDNATYYNGEAIPEWVKVQNWYVSEISGDRAVIDKNEHGTNSICSPINVKFLNIVKKAANENQANDFSPYLVKVTADCLNIRQGSGTNFECTGQITDRGVYTIIAESCGQGASLWGRLKSGAGWISLDYVKKI